MFDSNRFITWLLILLLLSFTSTGVIADEENESDDDDDDDDDIDEDSDHDDDDDWHRESHSSEVDDDDDGISIEIESENATVESSIELKFKYDESSFKVEFEEEKGSSEIKQEMKIRLNSIVEYSDVNHDGVFDSNDSALRSFRLSNNAEANANDAGVISWNPPIITDINQQGILGKEVELVGELSAPNETFTFMFRILSDVVTTSMGEVMPSQVKIDFIFDGWNWQSNTSRLALIMSIETEEEHEHGGNEISSNWSLSKTDLKLGFTWSEEVEVDGTTTALNSSVVVTGMSSELSLNYPQGARIVHDPILGAQYFESSGTGTPLDNNQSGLFSNTVWLLGLSSTILLIAGFIGARGLSKETETALDEDIIIPWLLPPPGIGLEKEGGKSDVK